MPLSCSLLLLLLLLFVVIIATDIIIRAVPKSWLELFACINSDANTYKKPKSTQMLVPVTFVL